MSARRIHLEDVVADADLVLSVRRLAANGLDAWAQVVGNGDERLGAKDETSVYEGGPTRRWLKVEQKDWTVEGDGWHGGDPRGGQAMMRLAPSVSLLVVLLLVSVDTASADGTCVSLRTFTLEERGRFDERYGVEWWKALGLIPGPAQPGDWVERPSGDSSRMLYMPQQFWDLRSCMAASKSAGPSKSMSNTTDPTTHRSRVADRLQELKRLHEQRLITDEEYEAKRRQILDTM